MSKYLVPLDLIIEATDPEDLQNIVKQITLLMYKDYYPLGLMDYDLPVGLPTEPDESYRS
jgi:hypothetical protein